jgi:serine/threonine protein kinase
LNHPHICVLYDLGSQDDVNYLVMECVEGETLAKRLEKGPLPLDQMLKFGAQIADALDKAHRSGVVHRDLKPGNVMLTPTGAKLLDFGLAKPISLASLATVTATAAKPLPATEQGSIVGTFQIHVSGTGRGQRVGRLQRYLFVGSRPVRGADRAVRF